MYRNAMNDLLAWKGRPGHKPLILKGARFEGGSDAVINKKARRKSRALLFTFILDGL